MVGCATIRGRGSSVLMESMRDLSRGTRFLWIIVHGIQRHTDRDRNGNNDRETANPSRLLLHDSGIH